MAIGCSVVGECILMFAVFALVEWQKLYSTSSGNVRHGVSSDFNTTAASAYRSDWPPCFSHCGVLVDGVIIDSTTILDAEELLQPK